MDWSRSKEPQLNGDFFVPPNNTKTIYHFHIVLPESNLKTQATRVCRLVHHESQFKTFLRRNTPLKIGNSPACFLVFVFKNGLFIVLDGMVIWRSVVVSQPFVTIVCLTD